MENRFTRSVSLQGIVIALVLLAGAGIFVASFQHPAQQSGSSNTNQTGSPVPSQIVPGNSLQLKTFYLTPTQAVAQLTQPPQAVQVTQSAQSTYCSHGVLPKNYTCNCDAAAIVCPNITSCQYDCGTPNFPVWGSCGFVPGPSVGYCNTSRRDADEANPDCYSYCYGKPVIYFYPLKDTDVSVVLHLSGNLITSIPTYPQQGWKHILAYPNGLFTYQGISYRELYYESNINQDIVPSD